MLEVTDLEVAYGAAPALWGVSLEVRQREMLCVIGPNGAGKTTLINAIAGIQRTRGGRIVFEGRDITQLAPHRFCEAGIALVPEGRRLFTRMTVLENLELGSYLPAAKAPGPNRSGGVTLFPMRRKSSTARTATPGGQRRWSTSPGPLMARPRLTAARRAVARARAAERARHAAPSAASNADGMAVLLVEQNVVMAMELSNRAYVLEEGRIVATGTPADLLARPEIQRAYLGV